VPWNLSRRFRAFSFTDYSGEYAFYFFYRNRDKTEALCDAFIRFQLLFNVRVREMYEAESPIQGFRSWSMNRRSRSYGCAYLQKLYGGSLSLLGFCFCHEIRNILRRLYSTFFLDFDKSTRTA
jgi:hypothetical protein